MVVLPVPGLPSSRNRPPPGQPAHGDIVQAVDSQLGFFTRLRHALAPATSVAFNAASPRNDPPPTEFAPSWQRRSNQLRKAGNVRFPPQADIRPEGATACAEPSAMPRRPGRAAEFADAVAYSSGAKLCRNMRLAGAGVAPDDLQFADLPGLLRDRAGAALRAVLLRGTRRRSTCWSRPTCSTRRGTRRS